MKSFFSSFFGAFLGVLIGLLLVVLIVTAMLPSEEEVSVPADAVLHLTLSDRIIDRGNDQVPPIDLGPLGAKGGTGLNHITEDLERAAADDRISGLFLDVSSVAASPSTLFDLRAAIEQFKESGKWVVAFSEGYTQGAYFLATAADDVFLYPQGDLDFRGLGAELMFYKRLLDEQGIEVTILRGPDNKYKSAVEPYMYDHMSEPNREQYQVLLDGIWDGMLAGISTARGIQTDSLQSMADNLTAMMPHQAEAKGLVDGLKHRDEVMAFMEAKINGAESMPEGSVASTMDDDESSDSAAANNPFADEIDVEFISRADYRKSETEEEKEDKPSILGDRIAVVYAVGAIESGDGDDETIGSARIAQALRDARTDDKVKAVVLRVNSPGGSALASDVIYRETQLIKEAGKPMIVSMGDLAASGGYYISCGADKIYAGATTITGSIGVYGMIPNAGPFLEETLGITTDRVATAEHTHIMSTYKSMDEVQLAAVNESVTHVYNQFIGLVAGGRGMSIMQVDTIAQGRVWTGADALGLGLVDELGDLEDAIAFAAAEAELDGYRIKNLPLQQDPFKELFGNMGEETRAQLLEQELGPLYQAYQSAVSARDILSWEGPQARLPYTIEIK